MCVVWGATRADQLPLLQKLDWPGLIYAETGFSLLYAGLDQGNRLDWTSDGLISGLLISGVIVTTAFIIREFVGKSPFLNLHVLLGGQLLILLLLLAGFRFIILSTAYIIPTYLQTVRSFRELQVGSVLLWIALPQFAIMWPLAATLKYVDARWVLASGGALIAVACLMATEITSQWATDDFLPSQILQAIGQSFALTALVVLIVQSINPRDVLTIGALLQISRLFGGELGTAFMPTLVRVREQLHSNLLGLHPDAFSSLTGDRLLGYGSAVGMRTLTSSTLDQKPRPFSPTRFLSRRRYYPISMASPQPQGERSSASCSRCFSDPAQPPTSWRRPDQPQIRRAIRRGAQSAPHTCFTSAAAINNNSLACYSAGMVLTQPRFSRASLSRFTLDSSSFFNSLLKLIWCSTPSAGRPQLAQATTSVSLDMPIVHRATPFVVAMDEFDRRLHWS